MNLPLSSGKFEANNDSLYANHVPGDSDAAAARRARRDQLCGPPVHEYAAVLPIRRQARGADVSDRFRRPNYRVN